MIMKEIPFACKMYTIYYYVVIITVKNNVSRLQECNNPGATAKIAARTSLIKIERNIRIIFMLTHIRVRLSYINNIRITNDCICQRQRNL